MIQYYKSVEMKIGVLGGSFDPPHNGHLWVAKTLLEHGLCQKIILIPCFKHPFSKRLTKPSHRLAMTKLLENKNIRVSDIELKKESVSYTIDTLNILQKQFPKYDFTWIIGEDQIESFTKWKNWRKIIEKFGLIVVPRRPPRGRVRAFGAPSLKAMATHGHLRGDPKGLLGDEHWNITVVSREDFKPIDISSSEIRKRVKEGKNIDALVPKKVKNYIIKHKLYV